jgi:hypothetical protein
MLHRSPQPERALPADENISGTTGAANSEDSPKECAEKWGCVYIAAERWLPGKPPFCGKPVLPGSPYCPRHAALCRAPADEARR